MSRFYGLYLDFWLFTSEARERLAGAWGVLTGKLGTYELRDTNREWPF